MSKKTDKTKLDKHGTNNSSTFVGSQRRTIVLTAIITAVITIAVERSYIFFDAKLFSPQVIAQFASFKAETRNVRRPRATYIIEKIKDTLTSEVTCFTAMAFPPDTTVAKLTESKFIVKLLIENRGWRTAKDIKIVLFQPGNSEFEVVVPQAVEADINDFNQLSHAVQGKTVLIHELGKKQSIVITAYLASSSNVEMTSGFSLTGYIVFDGKYLEWVQSPFAEIKEQCKSPENAFYSGVRFKVIKGRPDKKGKIPSTFLYTHKATSEEEAFKSFESSADKNSKMFPWEQQREHSK